MPCEHGRRKNRCVECGGAGICEHKKIRTNCKVCGGSGICEHKKVRTDCKVCGRCEHEKRKSRCIECRKARLYSLSIKQSKSSLCKHEISLVNCEVCNQLCEHNKLLCVYCKKCSMKERKRQLNIAIHKKIINDLQIEIEKLLYAPL